MKAFRDLAGRGSRATRQNANRCSAIAVIPPVAVETHNNPNCGRQPFNSTMHMRMSIHDPNVKPKNTNDNRCSSVPRRAFDRRGARQIDFSKTPPCRVKRAATPSMGPARGTRRWRHACPFVWQITRGSPPPAKRPTSPPPTPHPFHPYAVVGYAFRTPTARQRQGQNQISVSSWPAPGLARIPGGPAPISAASQSHSQQYFTETKRVTTSLQTPPLYPVIGRYEFTQTSPFLAGQPSPLPAQPRLSGKTRITKRT